MRARATFPRIATLALALAVGLLTITVAATAAEQGAATPTKVNATMSSLNHAANIDGYNPMETAVANYVAKKQAEEAAKKAAEEAAAQQAVANNAGNNSVSASGGGSSAAASDEEDAWAILASYGLDGVSLSFGDTQGYEAIAYYKSGHIVINPNHTYPLSTLIAHEVNHIIAYRQSGQTSE